MLKTWKTFLFVGAIFVALFIVFPSVSLRFSSPLGTAAEANSGDATIAATTNMRLSPASQSVYQGSSFTVDVMVDNASKLGGFEFVLSYDPAVLQASTAVLGDFLGSTGRAAVPVGPSIDSAAGRISFGGFSFGSAAGPNGSGKLATITFVASGSGSGSALSFISSRTTDDQGTPQTPTLQSGSVTIVTALHSVYLPVVKR
ncbi:MAG: hypothetical protein GXP41_00085 [Chloroflexi bacterium]|nr:hypothetical protein [Chloroflexota bacterium]